MGSGKTTVPKAERTTSPTEAPERPHSARDDPRTVEIQARLDSHRKTITGEKVLQAHAPADLRYLIAEQAKRDTYIASLEAECMAVTECAYALELTLNWAGNYGYDAKPVRHQEAKAKWLFYALFAARNNCETVGVRLLREKNEAAAAATPQQEGKPDE